MTRSTTGVDRFARELVSELDKIVQPGEVEIAVPGGHEIIARPFLESIEIKEVGTITGHLWEQTQFSSYLRKTGQTGINLCNTAPIANPGIVCIHDMAASAHPEFYKGKGLWRKVRLHFVTTKAKAILTVSEFSRGEILKYYPKTKAPVEVVYDAWQHVRNVEPDGESLSRYGLKEGEYFFALSSLTKNKNLIWTVKTALANPDYLFAVAGGINTKIFGDIDIPEAENVKYLGYVTDEEAKALMAGCKAFLFPSFYEGFGIPPLEAMANGAKVVVSDIEVLHEVYGESAIYIDPNVPAKNLCELVSESVVEAPDKALSKFSWERSAQKLYSVMNEIRVR